MANKITSITSKIFICEICDFKCIKKGDYNRHLLTAKHARLTKTNQITSNDNIILKCECSKEFKHKSSLSKHKKTCIFLKNNNTDLIQIENNKQITELKEDNKELKIMIKELIKENAKQQQQIGELIPKIGNNNTHNVNHKINIQIFLNNYCKNAIDIDEFTKSIQVSLEQLTFTKDNGLIHGLTNTIMENINKLNLYERPLHCTDLKRETLYIKDGTGWNKTDSREKLKSAINKISAKQYGTLKTWMDENPDFNTNESKQQFVANVLSTIGSDISQIDDKIIKKLCNGTYIKDSFE